MTKQYLADPTKGKYFTQVLNMADDDLGPYEMRLLIRYIRVAWKTGKCWEGVRRTSKITQMSVGMVTKTRNRLEELGYIKVKHRPDDTCVIVIVDRMAENVARYANEVDETEDDEFAAPSRKRARTTGSVHGVNTRSSGEQGVHVVNTPELDSVHGVNERIYITKEEEPKKNIKETTLSASAESAVSPVNEPFDLSFEADDAAMFVPKGKKQISAQAEKGSKRLSKPTTTPTTPQPPAAPAPVAVDDVETFSAKLDEVKGEKAKRKPNHTALVINTVWGKAVSGGLLPMLMGNAKKAPWKDHNIEGGMTEIEIFAFSRWYKKHNPGMNLVEQPHKVWAAVQSFRDAIDYDGWITEGEKLFPVYFPKEDAAPPVVEERATPEEIAAFRRQIIEGGLQDELGGLFGENVS
jgi:DNA-binding MarR family transcriptional regulator